ncbi:hypothetical protein ZWY2020_048902 [Hordeum vulgare]|nr:hypothetical protein ZWY2020_048902 [Hordeum vulgare]
MEEATLLPSSSACEEIGGDESLAVGDEVKRQLRLAGQFIVRGLMQNLIQMISVMFVGHLAELPLAGASMASSFAAVTGFSLLKDLITESDCSSMVVVRHVVAPTDIMFPAGVHQGVMGDDRTESVLVVAMRQGVEDWRMKSTAAGGCTILHPYDHIHQRRGRCQDPMRGRTYGIFRVYVHESNIDGDKVSTSVASVVAVQQGGGALVTSKHRFSKPCDNSDERLHWAVLSFSDSTAAMNE